MTPFVAYPVAGWSATAVSRAQEYHRRSRAVRVISAFHGRVAIALGQFSLDATLGPIHRASTSRSSS
jgi:hypothetical protein